MVCVVALFDEILSTFTFPLRLLWTMISTPLHSSSAMLDQELMRIERQLSAHSAKHPHKRIMVVCSCVCVCVCVCVLCCVIVVGSQSGSTHIPRPSCVGIRPSKSRHDQPSTYGGANV